MSTPVENKILKKKFFRTTFIAGIITMLPLAITLYVLKVLYGMIVSNLTPLISKALGSRFVIPDTLMGVVTILFFILCIFGIGLLIKFYIGRLVFDILEKTMARIPLVRTVYNVIKQMIDSFGSSANNFEKVVLVTFPLEGSYCLGFVVRNTQLILEKNSGNRSSYNVFVPTAPNPTSGFILITPVEKFIELPLTVDEGIKFILSVGVINFNAKSDALDFFDGKK